METHLSFKAQEIKSGTNLNEKIWAKAYFNKQEDKNLKSTRGHIFSVVSIEGANNIDFEFFGKLLFNTLQNEYFDQTDGTPLQALENATLKCKEQLGNLASQSEKPIDITTLNFNIISAVIWGKILYIVNLGHNKAFIIKGGETQTVSDVSDNNINSVSGRVDEKDTFILGNSIFSKIFEQTNNISELQKEIENAEKNGGVAAILVNLEIEKTVAEEEKITFISSEELNSNQIESSRETISQSLPTKKSKIKKTLKNFSKKQKLGFTAIIVGILLALSIFLNISKLQNNKTSEDLSKFDQATITTNIKQAKSYIGLNNDKAREILLSLKLEIGEESPKITEINELLDEINNVQEITNSKAVYDFSLKDPNFSIKSFVVSEDVLYILNGNTGSLYSYEQSVGAQEVATEIKELKYLVLCDNGLNTGSSDKLLNIDTNKSYDLAYPSNYTGLGCYLNNLYFTTSNNIIKFASDTYEQSTWLSENETLENALSNTIDSNIYLIENGNTITKLFTGNKSNFNLTGLDKNLIDATDVFVNNEGLFILDSGNKRVVQTDVSGELIAQFDISSYPAITKLWVENDNIYLANKTTIYTFSLIAEPEE